MLNNILICLSILCVLLLAPHQQCYGANNSPRFHKLRVDRLSKGTHLVGGAGVENSVMEKIAVRAQTVLAGSQDGLKESDKIDRLPGQPTGININQYSGYVAVDPKRGKTFFYYFVESWNSAASKPLVLWFSGDISCSAVGIGAFTEIGPFRINEDGKTLHLNQYAWNQEANILFVDFATSIGFSFSNKSLDYKRIGDKIITRDMYTFLYNWLERFPEYQKRDIYLAGESHLPIKLGQLILQKTKYSNHAEINLKGIAVGNGFIDFETYFFGSNDYAWTHALISDEIYYGVKSSCNISNLGSEKCRKYTQMWDNVTAAINPFNINAPLCNSTPGNNPYRYVGPCSTDYISTYLNNPAVQNAIHATAATASHPWEICSHTFTTWPDYPITLLPIITEVMREGIQILLYSGDLDSFSYPITSTRYAINKLELSVTISWYPWYHANEVGGYAVGYENLTFASVRGAGAFVPDSKPASALALFSSFLDGKLPPNKQQQP